MKTIQFKSLFLFVATFLLVFLTQLLYAQNNDANKSGIEDLLKNRNFVFTANSANPMRGSVVQLTSTYDLILTGDTVKTFLPYYGRSYTAPINAEGGIKITSTDFKYNVADKRKKRWNITIAPNDNKDVQQMLLSVSEDGYATLRVISTNKDPISFNGRVTAKR
jgi:hypothetical protein